MADAQIAHAKNVIKGFRAYNKRLKEMLAIPFADFNNTDYIVSNAVLLASDALHVLNPDQDVVKTMSNSDLRRLVDLVDKLTLLEDSVGENEKALISRVKAYGATQE